MLFSRLWLSASVSSEMVDRDWDEQGWLLRGGLGAPAELGFVIGRWFPTYVNRYIAERRVLVGPMTRPEVLSLIEKFTANVFFLVLSECLGFEIKCPAMLGEVDDLKVHCKLVSAPSRCQKISVCHPPCIARCCWSSVSVCVCVCLCVCVCGSLCLWPDVSRTNTHCMTATVGTTGICGCSAV
jgi:hypothetical protein